MTKLLKSQQDILANAVQSERAHGVKKPITVFTRYRGQDMTGYPKSFALYTKQMWALIDAGLGDRPGGSRQVSADPG